MNLTPAQQLRLRWIRGSWPMRAGVCVVAVLAVVGLGAAMLPAASDTTELATDVGSPGPGGDPASVTSTSMIDGPSADGTTSGMDSATSGQASSSERVAGAVPSERTTTEPQADAPACPEPGEGARGVDGEVLRIAVGLTSIVGPAANGLLGLPSADEQRRMFQAVIDGINEEGGVACRRLVADYYEANPADESQMTRICFDVAGSDVFAMIDTGALSSRPNVLACFGSREVPFFTGYAITEDQRRRYYPYLYGFYAREQLYDHTVQALQSRGFFDPAKGFEKLGWLIKTCQTEAIQTYRALLAEIGMSGDRVVEYDIGCPTAFASPADLQQAVLTFQSAGVTHVLTADIQGDLAVFTNTAESQGFRPRYGFPDESVISLSYGSQRPNPENIDGALAITNGRQGEERTPGVTPTDGTLRCNAYYEAVGMPDVYDQHGIAGNTCDELWMLRAGLDNAPEISAAGLQAGLEAARSIDFSFPQGPNDLTADGTTTGGQFWRAATFVEGCACWRLATTEFVRGRR